jgi:NADH dehydrogenase [ubiquinone] 1 alpha subcomplex assembly factor 5
MADEITLFDRRAICAHRDRAALLPREGRFLRDEVQARLVDRLNDVTRDFALALDLGAGDGGLAPLIAATGRQVRLVALDRSWRFARRLGAAIVGDEEALPFADASVDLVISTLGLHWTNDLPGALIQLRRVLRPDGLLLAALFGGETLWQLREALTRAEIEIAGGAGPRVSPFADLRDCGGLLQRAGFALPVVDGETLTLTYPNALALMRELRALGETNALLGRARGVARRAVLLRAASLYADLFGDAGGRIPASFQIVTLTGWAPAASQPLPLKRGSAQFSLAAALGGVESGAGDPISEPPSRPPLETPHDS